MRRRSLLTAVALIAFGGETESGETAFKQYPADLLTDHYFVKTPMPKYPDVAAAYHKKGSGWHRNKNSRRQHRRRFSAMAS
jgi:hypothetical protein